MAIPSKQIGWGTEENLLWQISKQLESLTGVASTITGGTGSSGSSGTSGGSGSSGSAGTAGLSGSSGSSGITGTSGLSGDRYATTSTTSFTLGSGGTITIGTGLAYTVAQDISIANDITHHQISEVVSYNSGTGVLVFGAPSETIGSGTFTSWVVNLNGAAGGNGSSGTSGSSGVAGTSGIAGTSGVTGTSGSSGTSGASGTNGSSGTSASSGTSGLGGTAGTAGIAGTAGTSGTSSGPTTSYGLFAQTADSTPVTATTVETTIIGTGVGGLTVPANGFQIGDSFTASLDGVISCVSSATIHIHVKTLTGVILADTGIITLAAATDKNWIMNLYFTIRTLGGATVASISSGGLFSYIRNGGTQFEGYVLSTVNNTTFDTTINNTLVITAQWNTTNAGNSIVSKNFNLIKVY
jgi:hypothetical protein